MSQCFKAPLGHCWSIDLPHMPYILIQDINIGHSWTCSQVPVQCGWSLPLRTTISTLSFIGMSIYFSLIFTLESYLQPTPNLIPRNFHSLLQNRLIRASPTVSQQVPYKYNKKQCPNNLGHLFDTRTPTTCLIIVPYY